MYAIHLNLSFDYFILLSSNEMFIKNGLIDYIKKYKNGVQLVENNPNVIWHNFQKNIENSDVIKKLLGYLQLKNIYGGQAEGQFYEKNIFKKVVDIYFTHFGNNELQFFGGVQRWLRLWMLKIEVSQFDLTDAFEHQITSIFINK